MDMIAAVILAAGQGKRMKSRTPKVLHKVAGQSLVQFPVDLAKRTKCSRVVVVVGHGREQVEAALSGQEGVSFAMQVEQRGTGHAVMCALPKLRGHKGPVLILSGDVPLLDKQSVNKLARAHKKSGGPLSLLTFCPTDPHGYGRIIREGNRVVDIREERDCTRPQKAIEEVNAGIYFIDIDFLRRSVKKLKTDNAQGEFYLTDLVRMAAKKGRVAAIVAPQQVVSGVNDRVDLAHIETIVRERTNLSWMRGGVTIRQWQSVQIDLDVQIGRDTEIGPGVQLLGRTTVGAGCNIDAGAVISNATIKDCAVIKPYSVIEDAIVGPRAEIGPMGRLRPGAEIGDGAKIGNFVEVKNTVLGAGSKANHLAYLGDGRIGERVNVGAGTIFCNYDGFSKHQTVLEDEVFIGSDSQLVAPVTVGRGAYVASGSTVTRDVPADALAVARSRQKNREGLAAILRGRLAAAKEKAAEQKAAKKARRKGRKKR